MFLPLVAASLLPLDIPPRERIPVRVIRPADDAYRVALRRGRVYASGFHSGGVSAVDLASGTVLGRAVLDGYEKYDTEDVGGETVRTRRVGTCSGGAVVFAAGRLFVEQVFSDSVVVIDPDTMRIIRRIPVGGEGELAVSPDGTTVYFASNRKDEFHVIDAETYRHRAVAYPAGGRGIGALAVSPDGGKLLLGVQRGGRDAAGKTHGGGNGFLAVYDLAAGKYAATVYLAEMISPTQSDDSTPSRIVYSPDEKTVYVSLFQSVPGVRVIDPKTWAVTADLRFTPNGRDRHFPWTNPRGMGFVRGWLLVAVSLNEEVHVIDPATRRTAARLRSARGEGFRDILTDGDRVLLTDGRVVCELDGRALAERVRAWHSVPGRGPLDLGVVRGE